MAVQGKWLAARWWSVAWGLAYYSQAGWVINMHSHNIPSAIEWYSNEVRRVTGVLDLVLQKQEWLIGNHITYVDSVFVPAPGIVVMICMSCTRLWRCGWTERKRCPLTRRILRTRSGLLRRRKCKTRVVRADCASATEGADCGFVENSLLIPNLSFSSWNLTLIILFSLKSKIPISILNRLVESYGSGDYCLVGSAINLSIKLPPTSMCPRLYDGLRGKYGQNVLLLWGEKEWGRIP